MEALFPFTPVAPHWSNGQFYTGTALGPDQTLISITFGGGTIGASGGLVVLDAYEGFLSIDGSTGGYSLSLNQIAWESVDLADNTVLDITFLVNYTTDDGFGGTVIGSTDVTIAVNVHGINSTIYPTTYPDGSHADGTNLADLMLGSDAVEGYTGNDGSDRIYAGGGDDTVFGGANDDFIFGEGGHDQLQGDGGADEIYGGTGNDTINGGDGSDTIDAGAGDDIIYYDASDASIDGGADTDTLIFDSDFEFHIAQAAGFANVTNVEYGQYTETPVDSIAGPVPLGTVTRTVELATGATVSTQEVFADGSSVLTTYYPLTGALRTQQVFDAAGNLTQSSDFPLISGTDVVEHRVIHDVSGEGPFDYAEQTYTNGELQYERIQYYDGTSQVTDYDTGDIEDWYAAIRVYDATGMLVSENFLLGPPGTTVTTTTLDEDGTAGWSAIQHTLTAEGALIETVTTMDNGSVQTLQFENGVTVLHSVTDTDANERSWSSRTVEWTPEGVRTARTTIDDDGMRRVERYDPVTGARIERTDHDDADAESWTSRSTFWDDSGTVMTRTQLVLDDGRVEDVTFDPVTGAIVSKTMTDVADAYDWTSKSTTFDAETGDTVSRTLTYDDGSSLTHTFADGAKASRVQVDGSDDMFDWVTQEILYAAEGAYQINQVMDDGDIVEIEMAADGSRQQTTFDISGDAVWHIERITYDAVGQATGTEYLDESGDSMLF